MTYIKTHGLNFTNIDTLGITISGLKVDEHSSLPPVVTALIYHQQMGSGWIDYISNTWISSWN
jgi:hypothetical protein